MERAFRSFQFFAKERYGKERSKYEKYEFEGYCAHLYGPELTHSTHLSLLKESILGTPNL